MSKVTDSKMAPSTTKLRKDLGFADDQIARLKKRFLPHDPHILKVTKEIMPDPAIEEYKRTAFQDYEVRNLQYMTLVYEDLHGDTLKPHGDWADEIEAGSPTSLAALSNTSTPAPPRDPSKPVKRLKLCDYKNLQKSSALKTSPKGKGEAGPNNKHSRTTSAVTSGTPMSRMSSLEGLAPAKQNGTSREVNPARNEKPPTREHDRPSAPSARPHDRHHDAKEPPRSVPNSNIPHTAKSTLQNKDANKDPRPHNSQHSQLPPIRHSLPPRPPSPPHRNPESKYPPNVSRQAKRPLESGAATQPEKRARIEEKRPAINPPGTLPRKPEHINGNKPSSRLQNSHSQSSQSSHSQNSRSTPHTTSPPRRSTPTTKRIETGKSAPSSAEKPLDLPPLLSPLPADLEPSPARPNSSFTSIKKSESGKNSSQNSSQNTLPKGKYNASAIAVKKPLNNDSSPLTTPPASSSPFIPPPMLSPSLPDIVERELEKIQLKAEEKKAEGKKRSEEKSTLNSVEARHEKVRRPDTPGVARKVSAPKVGHPPKKTNGEPSKPKMKKELSRDNGESSSAAAKQSESWVVVLKIPKRKRKDVSRILGIKPRPDKTFLKLEEERERVSSTAPSQEPEHKESEHKILPKTASKTVISATSKKRNSDSFDSEPGPSSSNKRLKAPNSLDVSKAKPLLEPPFKSPSFKSSAVDTPTSSQKLLSTPKKGDALKGVLGRKIESSDSHPRTPQMASGSTSTPTSAERPRTNGLSSNSTNTNGIKPGDAQGDEHQRIGLKLKRVMDGILHTKTPNFDYNTLSEPAKKLGLCVGIECFAHFLNRFTVLSKNAPSHNPPILEWEGGSGLELFVRTLTEPFPVLREVQTQVGALYKEGLNRCYVQAVEKDGPNYNYHKAPQLIRTSQSRDRLWAEAHAGQAHIDKLGGEPLRPLGPWSSGEEAMGYVEEVLGRYAKKEGLKWKKFPGEY